MSRGDSPDNKSDGKNTELSRSFDGLGLLAGDRLVLSKEKELFEPHTEPATTGISRLASVYAEILPAIPASIAGQLKNDLNEAPGKTALKALESCAIGLGATVALARSPVLAKTILGATGIGAGLYLGGEAAGFSYEAFNAVSAEERAALVLRGKSAAARLGAELIETGPALALGAGAAKLSLPRVATLDSIASKVRDSAELGMRRIVPEGFHFASTDAGTLSLRGQGGHVDLLKAGQELMERTPWRGVEDGRFIRLKPDALKMSAKLPGAREEVMMGRRSESLFHTHEKSVLPSSGDFNSVYGTGIVGVPKEGLLVFYEGTGRQAEAIGKFLKAGKLEEASAAAESLHNRTFRSMAVDPARELAARVDLRWNPSANRLEPTAVQALDYAGSVKNLSKWGGALNIESMPLSQQSLLKPGMTDFLRKVLNQSGV